MQKKYSQLVYEMNGNVKGLNDNIINVVLESAIEIGGKALKKTGEISQQLSHTQLSHIS